MREQVRALDKDVPVTHIQTMDQVFGASVAQQRFSMLVVGLFAGLALVLASVGIYGVMAYSVAQRAHEIGVRMALGARTAQVLKLILKDGMTLALLGVGVGLAGASRAYATDRDPAVRRDTNGCYDFDSRVVGTARRGAGCVLHPGAPRDESRSVGGAQVRMKIGSLNFVLGALFLVLVKQAEPDRPRGRA